MGFGRFISSWRRFVSGRRNDNKEIVRVFCFIGICFDLRGRVLKILAKSRIIDFEIFEFWNMKWNSLSFLCIFFFFIIIRSLF